MTNREIYVRFLSVTQALESRGELADVDLLGQKLLELLAIAAEKISPWTLAKPWTQHGLLLQRLCIEKSEIWLMLGMFLRIFWQKSQN